ncbi:MAG: C4-type zinc ribbon domain-containing protein [Chloroflexi bacterium]|nr:C4-type zinc ribbon domain-containing protein [Chloroflexota bacterium]
MSSAGKLFELQEIDLAIDKKMAILKDLDVRLADNKTVVAARTELENLQELFNHLVKQQKETEWEIESFGEKLKTNEKKLYGGTVKNPKDLVPLTEENQQLKTKKQELEDKDIDLMSEIDNGKQKVELKKKEYKQIQIEWGKTRERLSKDQNQINSDLNQLSEKKKMAEFQLNKTELYLYETLRKAKNGVAVSRVEQGLCQGCRINLPVSYIQRARTGQELVQCGNCSRILYVS